MTTTTDREAVLGQVNRQELVDLTCEMLRVPSIKGTEAAHARILAPWFEERGYEVWLQELDHGLINLTATLKGTGGGKSLMFNGHLDIDPVVTFGWSRDPFEPYVDGNKLHGAGVINMKGPNACSMHAAEAIRKSGVKLKGDVVVSLVAGELQGGYGMDELLKTGYRVDAAICCEAFGTKNVLTMNTGTANIAVSVKGYTRHIMYKKDAVDAIAKIIKIIPAINNMKFTYEPRPDLPDVPTIHVGAVIGGRGENYALNAPNYVSDYCTILCDVRFLPGQTIESVRQDIINAIEEVRKTDPEIDYEVQVPVPLRFGTGLTKGHEPFEIPVDAPIVQTVVKNRTEVMGEPPELVGVHIPGSYSGDDTSHMWAYGIPCVLFGPGHPNGINSAFADEFMDIDEMVAHAKILAMCALDICNEDKEA